MKNIFDLFDFKEISVGNVQTTNEMSVLPLIGKNHVCVAEPQNFKFIKTITYGSMVFKNEDDKPAIVPAHYMVRGLGAQDHAMAGSGLIPAKKQITFDNACCIEQTQGGLLQEEGNEEDILPISLRKIFLSNQFRSKRNYDKLWGKISEWLKGINPIQSSRAHLRYFYDCPEIKQILEEFAAEFEPIEGQVGAIVMFYGYPVGIEIMPNEQYWNKYWKQILRGCYSAELIRLKYINKIEPTKIIFPELPETAHLDEIENIITEYMKNMQQQVAPILEGIKIKDEQVLSNISNYKSELILTDKGGGGDLIYFNNEPIYLSLIL